MTEIGRNLERIRGRIDNAAKRSGRGADDVQLIAVTKTVAPEKIAEALAAGVTDIGENRIQEARTKQAIIGRGVRWHLIGHLQSNKAKTAIEMFDLIHSLDSLRLAEALERQAAVSGRNLPVLVQVNIGREPQKSGVDPDDLLDFLSRLSGFGHLRVQGLMAIPPYTPDSEGSRIYYRRLADLFRQAGKADLPGVDLRYLSMGMSHDFEVAIEEGANMVRVGSAIFGPREA